MAGEKQYLQLYEEHRSLLEQHSCDPMNRHRAAAAEWLREKGLPTQRNEQYKYTDADAAFAPDYGLNLRRVLPEKSPYEAFRCHVPNLSTLVFYMVNDVVCAPLPTQRMPEGVRVVSLCEMARENAAFIDEYLHRLAAKADDGVTALNTLLAQDGWVIHIARGVQLDTPIQIVSIQEGHADLMSNRRVLVVAEEGSDATVLFCHHTAGSCRYLSTEVMEAYVHPQARLRLYSVEETGAGSHHFCQTYAEVMQGGRLEIGNIHLHGELVRHTSHIRLAQPGAEAEMLAAVVAGNGEHVDHNVLVEHAAEQCTSDMLHKYVLTGKSVSAFAGKVLVCPGAQHTLSQQTNANLCASPEARAYSQPMLEIYADDVKCNHGSTTGKLDENALFYMRQRGIAEDEARLLLQHAFVNDVLQRIELVPLRERLAHLVELRFRGELGKCRGCTLCR